MNYEELKHLPADKREMLEQFRKRIDAAKVCVTSDTRPPLDINFVTAEADVLESVYQRVRERMLS